jgi:hypothetical protein
MTVNIDKDFLLSLVDVDAGNQRVQQRLAALREPQDVLRFFTHYAGWNGYFANGVAALASLIGNSKDLFREAGFPRAVADRSNYVASFIFDAARDEYDDHINPLRDTHRCMAQASLISMQGFFQLDDAILNEDEPPALQTVNASVIDGYTGSPASGRSLPVQVFHGMGYHLGSELLADKEFSFIDEHLRQHRNDLVQHLMRATVHLAGGAHRCYAWVGVHSGHGGGVEADHFDYALDGMRAAFRYLVGAEAQTARDALVDGFRHFERDHQRFFAIGMAD